VTGRNGVLMRFPHMASSCAPPTGDREDAIPPGQGRAAPARLFAPSPIRRLAVSPFRRFADAPHRRIARRSAS
jgi:hypothetical protein